MGWLRESSGMMSNLAGKLWQVSMKASAEWPIRSRWAHPARLLLSGGAGTPSRGKTCVEKREKPLKSFEVPSKHHRSSIVTSRSHHPYNTGSTSHQPRANTVAIPCPGSPKSGVQSLKSVGPKILRIRHLHRLSPFLGDCFRHNILAILHLHRAPSNGPCMILVWSSYLSPVQSQGFPGCAGQH